MDAPEIRIGWLRMLLKVFRRYHPLYAELVAHAERMIAEAEKEARRVR